MRKFLVVGALALGTVGLMSGVANAQYPPEPVTLTVSDTTLDVGQQFDAEAKGFDDGSVSFEFRSDPVALGSTTSTGGVARLRVTTPNVAAGAHTVVATGTSNGQGKSVSAAVTVNSTGSNTTLPRTGSSNTDDLVRLGLVALAGGGVLLLGTRKRRSAA